jgi:glycerol uptake facilitator-like aquaporin
MNPARSFGPAMAAHFMGGRDISYLWMYFVGPAIGGLVAGVLYRAFMPPKQETPGVD